MFVVRTIVVCFQPRLLRTDSSLLLPFAGLPPSASASQLPAAGPLPLPVFELFPLPVASPLPDGVPLLPDAQQLSLPHQQHLPAITLRVKFLKLETSIHCSYLGLLLPLFKDHLSGIFPLSLLRCVVDEKISSGVTIVSRLPILEINVIFQLR